MKHLFKLPALVLGLVLLLTGFTQKVQAQDDDISLQTFYDELSPYGTWIQDPEYGYIWRPDVDQSDFRPYYSSGRWVMTEYGNTWVSDYDWGWAPFHYGRWVNRYNQWMWVPDTVWGPAWVSWRSGGGYYGWAPLLPGLSINLNFGSYHIPNNYWSFVPQGNIYHSSFPRYRGYRNVTIIKNTTYINYTGQRNRNAYFTGPRRDDVRRATNRDVPVYNVARTNRSARTSISNNTVNIYSPRSNNRVDNKNAAPRSVTPATAYNNNSRSTRGNASNEARNNRPDVQGNVNRADRAQRNTPREVPQRTEANQRVENTERAQRTERVRQEQTTRTQQQLAEVQQRTREQAVARSQQQAEVQQRSREEAVQRNQQMQQQRQERSQQQAEAQQRSREQAAQRSQQQAEAQQRSREQATQRTQQMQQQRQERVQQSAPSRGGFESRGGGQSQSQSSGRASRSSRG